MYRELSKYGSPPPLRSTLLKNPPDALPPVSELKMLENELQTLRTKLKERGKKAGADIKVIEESMRRMKEGEKGKAKSVDKVKRERDFTPIPDAEDSRLSVALQGKARLSSHPAQPVPSSSRSSVDPRSGMIDDRKKKKRKRDHDESEVESVSNRHRKGTPPVVHHPPPPPPVPIKAQKSLPTSSLSHPKAPAGGIDFSAPPPVNLLPQRPPIPPPPQPGPSKPLDVMDNFSNLKAPSQTSVTTFYSSIEPWIRNIREDDIGYLENTGDDVEPFIIPKLGRHYQEIWDDHDNGIYPPPNEDAPKDIFEAPDPNWDPSTLDDNDCLSEQHGHGPFTERVISALLPMENQWKGVKDAEDAMEGRPGGSGAAASKKEKLTASELEIKIRDNMRYHEILKGIPDYSEKVDDPITTAIREGQRELRAVVARNTVRRKRLVAIAKDRLGYQEYLDYRESIDKNISAHYDKLQRKDAPKAKKRKMGSGNGEMNGASSPPQLPPCPAALGLGPDPENALVVDKKMREMVESRRKWKDMVGSVFDKIQEEQEGRLWGVPKRSIYEGLEEEVRAILSGKPMSVAVGPLDNGKRKDKDKDSMDVG